MTLEAHNIDRDTSN